MSRGYSFIFLASLILAAPAAAQNAAVCDDLHGQMANITETIGTSRQLRQFQSAIVEQSFAIRKLNNDLQDNECSSGSMVIINGNDDGTCARIEDALKQRQQDLADLVARRDRMRHDDGTDGVTRGQLSKALHANGCDDENANDNDTIISNRPEAPLDAEPSFPGMAAVTPLDQSGGPAAGEENPQSPIQSYAYGQSYGGNVRTVCVRTCDGGFFPMTPNATPGDFQRDGETCARMCPGVKTELFFHQPNQETSTMISASSGTPYSAMPYAFAFRKRQPNEKTTCTCNLPAYYEEMRRENALTQPQRTDEPQSSITTIGPKTAQPEAPKAPDKKDIAPAERPYDPASGKVRQVGPTFLLTDQRKLDLTHPAAPGAQPER